MIEDLVAWISDQEILVQVFLILGAIYGIGGILAQFLDKKR